MGCLRTLAFAVPNESLRNPTGSYADAYGRFVSEMEAFRGYMIPLAGRLVSPPGVPAGSKTAGHEGTADAKLKKTKGRNINAEMLKLLADKSHEVIGWTARQWARRSAVLSRP